MIKNKQAIIDSGLFLYEVGMLIMIDQLPDKKIEEKIREEWYDNGKSDSLDVLEYQGYIKYIKKKNPWNAVRLSKKGKELIKDLISTPVTDLAKECLDLLVYYYEVNNLKSKITNKKKTLFYINEWLYYKEKEKGISYSLKQFEAVLSCYFDSFDYNELKFVKNSLKLFFDSDNAYASKWYPESCPFEEFICRNIHEIKDHYIKLNT